MQVLLGTVFVASLLGSLHCVGMCGPFALLASSNQDQNGLSWFPAFAYSLGRLITYSIVGALFGAIGLALNAGSTLVHWQQSATFVAGLLMIAVGIIALLRCLGLRIRLPKFVLPIQSVVQAGFSKTRMMHPVARALTFGALTSLMPCGWLYTFAITAAGTGSPLWGAILMSTFWAGTVPILAALMLGFDRLGASLQKHIPVAMATIVVLVGIFTIGFRSPITIASDKFQVASEKADLVSQIKNIDHNNLPCCCNRNEP